MTAAPAREASARTSAEGPESDPVAPPFAEEAAVGCVEPELEGVVDVDLVGLGEVEGTPDWLGPTD